jgi:hypothetical protein
MKTEKHTVSIRLEVDKETHKKIKLVQAKLLLEGKELGIPELCAELLAKGTNVEISNLKIDVK